MRRVSSENCSRNSRGRLTSGRSAFGPATEVGTLRLGGRNYGLVQTKDGLGHRVLPGTHLGQNDGRITAIEEGKISLIEIVPDGMGGFIERPAALALSE